MSDSSPSRAPLPLLLAAVLVGLQGVGLVALGVVGLADVVPARIEVGVSVSLFFGAYGVALVACAWALTRARGWARGPVMLTQLIQLGIAWNARDNTLLALLLAVTALVTLVAMVQPASIAALLGVPEEEQRDASR